MSALNVDIPQINITPEAEEDDDHSFLNLADALTDVEDLYENAEEEKTAQTKKKSKLIIKLTEDGGTTDMEDFEGSDEEAVVKIVKHKKPVLIDDLDLEGGVFEETYKINTRNSRGRRKLKTQFSTRQDVSKNIVNENQNVSSNSEDKLTDTEDYDTENEIKQEIPDTEIDLELYRSGTENNVADHIQKNDRRSLASPISGLSDNEKSFLSENVFQSSDFLSAPSLSPNLSDFTDIEIIPSDTEDDEQLNRRTKNRRRRGRLGQKNQSVTDVENLEMSDPEIKSHRKPKRKTRSEHNLKVKNQSLLIESDNEGIFRLPFPICKKVAEKSKVALRIPEFDTNFVTDTEDIEVDNEIENNIINEKEDIFEEAFEQKLDEIATYYSAVREETSLRQGPPKYKTYIEELEAFSDHEQESTDTANYETENEHDICESTNKRDNVEYKIRFSPSDTNLKHQTNVIGKNKLVLPTNPQDSITDCENIDSSPDEEMKQLPIAVVRQLTLTDDEDFAVDEADDADISQFELPDIELPPPTRNLVLLQENNSLVPTIRILPLDDSETADPTNNTDLNSTDEEDISEAEEVKENLLNIKQPVRATTPDLPVLDGGLVNVVENLHRKLAVTSDALDGEPLTDTEEVFLETREKRRRAPKFKHLHEKSVAYRKKLAAEKNTNSSPTDTEDVYLSDDKRITQQPNLDIPEKGNCILTDKENIDISEDDNIKPENAFRALSPTPQYMKELGGESVMVLREGSGPFSIIDGLNVNREHFKFTPRFIGITQTHTDTEDLAISADDEIDYTTYSAAETAIPHQSIDSINFVSNIDVHEEITRKFDEDTEFMYLKGGGFIDHHTDVENVSLEEGAYASKEKLYVSVNREEKKVSLNQRHFLVSFDAHKEWDASGKPAVSKPATVGLSAAQQGDDKPTDSQKPTSSISQVETEESQDSQKAEKSKGVADQHQLSGEMKELLKELEKESKQ